MWGQECVTRSELESHRIIPTRVGTSAFSDAFKTCAEDHPHACGDKYLIPAVTAIIMGSSPRVWGQEVTKMILIGAEGIIPTRVGTSDRGV